VIVVNGILSYDLVFIKNRFSHVIVNQNNFGIAHAINQGASYAFSCANADFVLILDQDSKISDKMTSSLLSVWDKLHKSKYMVSCVVPSIVDSRYNDSKSSTSKYEHIIVKTAPSSGMLICRKSFEVIGYMDERLFIDGVDHEWCLRGASLGYSVVRSTKAIMHHQLADCVIDFLFFSKRYHLNLVRNYYILRNSLLLIRRPYISWKWKVREFVKMLFRVFGYLYCSSDRKQAWFYIKNGLLDGFFGVEGKIRNMYQ
jgi:rhamnosyltransferase